ncbi:hypothetical protein PF005_g11853 [Phytophthora fragariae]|uniref:Uncharacterized protein n=2 Tax=Phytophthora fragariae TaxID=53985 RepID=A0A6A3SMR3_9STRA|nr:hypothetical protein PF003_g25951 [Phytophthora fragariae]KAE9114732.1 hypothetical protein PF007_g10270 [Phytophthora fragariae]KAE9147624.1 hypothetical protein PF006_g7707 [Phytophthora fragariae]KAE9209358.1 hypothetical protein PF005_g11853 [Phytophthora fragariae]
MRARLPSMDFDGGDACAATEHGGPFSIADGEDDLHGDFDAAGASGGATTADINVVTAVMQFKVAIVFLASVDGRSERASQGSTQPPRDIAIQYANLFLVAELEEMAALKAKGLIQETGRSDMPEDTQLIRTGWV